MKTHQIHPASIIECIASYHRDTHTATFHLEGLGVAFHEPRAFEVQESINSLIACSVKDRFADADIDGTESLATLKLIQADLDEAVSQIARARNAIACLIKKQEQTEANSGSYANSRELNLVSSL